MGKFHTSVLSLIKRGFSLQFKFYLLYLVGPVRCNSLSLAIFVRQPHAHSASTGLFCYIPYAPQHVCADYAYAHPRKVYPIVTSGTRTCADKRYGWIADAAACEAAAGLKDRKTETAGRRIES